MIIQEGMVSLPFEKIVVYLLSKSYSDIPDPYSPVPFNGGFLEYLSNNPSKYSNLMKHIAQCRAYFDNERDDIDINKLCPCDIRYLSKETLSEHLSANHTQYLEPYLAYIDLPEELDTYETICEKREDRQKLYSSKLIKSLSADNPDSWEYNRDPLHIHYYWYILYIDWSMFAATKYDTGAIRLDVYNSFVNSAMVDNESGDIVSQSDIYSTDEVDLAEDFSIYENRIYQLAQQLYRLGKRGPHSFPVKWRPLNMISFVACEMLRRKYSSTEVLTNYNNARIPDKFRLGFKTALELETEGQSIRQNESFKWAVSAVQGHVPVVGDIVQEFISLLEMLKINLSKDDLSRYDPDATNIFGSSYLPSNDEYTNEIYAALTDMTLMDSVAAAKRDEESKEFTLEDCLDRFYNAEIYWETAENKSLPKSERYVPVSEVLKPQEEIVADLLQALNYATYERFEQYLYVPRELTYKDGVLLKDNGKPYIINSSMFAYDCSCFYDCVILDSGFIVPIDEDMLEVWQAKNILNTIELTTYFKHTTSISGGSAKIRCL